MFFEELIEQHRVHRFVAHAVGLSVGIASHQIGVDLLHFLGHESKLWDALGIKFQLVAEGDRFERENRFARLIHRLNRFLETRRGDDRAEVTVGIYDHSYTSSDGYSADSGDKCVLVNFFRADTNSPGLATSTSVAYIDIVITVGEAVACITAQGNIERTGAVDQKRTSTVSRVVAAGCVAGECINPVGGVVASGCVAEERINPVGGIVIAGEVEVERLNTAGRV